jgi:hypothetical protein
LQYFTFLDLKTGAVFSQIIEVLREKVMLFFLQLLVSRLPEVADVKTSAECRVTYSEVYLEHNFVSGIKGIL